MAKSKLKICIVDNIGSAYLPNAIELSKYFDKTYYYTAIQSPFPYVAPVKCGIGYNEIEVITTFWDQLDKFDLIIFFDIYFSDWGKHLKKMGKLVWGGGDSEDIETNRKLFYSILERTGMDNGDYVVIQGIQKLKSYLKGKKNKFVKLSYFRGQQETFQYISDTHNAPLLDEMEYNLGPLGREVEFIVQSMIKSDAECGFDGFAINGVTPQNFIQGIEIKNAGYLGKADNQSSCPEPIRQVNEQFAPALQAYHHTGFYSTEVRYNTNTKQSYYIDPCMRAGSPPNLVVLKMIDNWDQILPEGAKGNLVEPHFKAKYGVEIILKSTYVNQNFLPIDFPPEYKGQVNLKGSFLEDNRYYIIPFKKVCGFDLEEIGSVTVIGNDYKQIMEQAMEIASKVEAYDLRFESNALTQALEQMAVLEEKLNFKF